MKEALYYKKMKNKFIQCQLCPKFCVIKKEEYGNCGARKNVNGVLYSLVYSMPCAAAVDPVEKKPLFHFLPGSRVFSVGTAGCNLHCKFCQNWTTAQVNAEEVSKNKLSPKQVVDAALLEECESIAYTYNEPTVFFEYVIETAKLAKKKGLKNILVTNGFINPDPLKEISEFIDAANIDLKSMDESFYENVCDAKLKPVLASIKLMKKLGIWIEVTNLIIPRLNDEPEQVKKLCDWIVENIGKDVPLHFSGFFPTHKLLNNPSTSVETLLRAKRIAETAGIKFVYVGNISTIHGETTFCPNCKTPLIVRDFYFVRENKLDVGRCSNCGEEINGVWN